MSIIIELTKRELTLIRVACLRRLNLLKSRPDMQDSYEETRTLMNDKLKAKTESTAQYTVRYRDNGSVAIVAPDGRESMPVGYQGFARLDNYVATSDYYRGVLPTLFKTATVID